MTAKEYLNQAYKLNEQIKDKQERIMQLKTLTDSIGAIDYSKDRVQTSPQPYAPYVNQLANIDELEKELNDDLLRLCQLQVELNRAIDAVEDVDCKLILSKRYLLMKTWEQIADEMGYSLTQTHRIHAKGVEIFVVP